jgi:serine/threonine protein kinase
VAVHEVGLEDGGIFIVSDFVQGVTLADWLTAHQVAPRNAAELCVIVAAALEHAHQAGLVHRDLKPSNIMLDERGQPHLMDFGLAKQDAAEITMTVEASCWVRRPTCRPNRPAVKVTRRTDAATCTRWEWCCLSC